MERDKAERRGRERRRRESAEGEGKFEKEATHDIESDERGASDNEKRIESERARKGEGKLDLSEEIESEQGEIAGLMEENRNFIGIELGANPIRTILYSIQERCCR